MTSATPGATQARGGSQTGARLEARGLSIVFGGLAAVDNVDLDLAQGEILGLIGPNGAGKTTLVNGLSGFQEPTSGNVFLNGEDITSWPPHKRARAGLTRTFQQVRLFMELSALDNIQVAAMSVGERSGPARRLAYKLLDLFDLGGKEDMRASALPYGDERRLSVARSLACRPALLLLDEPAAGLNEAETKLLAEELAALPGDYGCGMLVIEHDMSLIMSLCERIQVLNFGKTIAVGTPAEVRADDAVIEAYLGTDDEESAA